MFRILLRLVERGLDKRVPAVGLGVFRICFSLVILQEIAFLFYFQHLIFDPLPYVDRASPIIQYFLIAWFAAAACLAAGYKTRRAAVVNYAFWILFVVFTPMWQDFDGGFDQLMTATSFLLIFVPGERGLSLDNLRLKLRRSTPARHYQPPNDVSVLAYYLPLAVSLGLLYLDSGIHKLSSEFWRNGMGSWLPPTMPYYASALDVSPLLNLRSVEQAIGYSIIGFQFVFLFLLWVRRFRVPLMLTGATFHTGIILSLNIYPFGFAMLVHYLLMVPFRWWQGIRNAIGAAEPALTVFYDEACPLCNRTVIVIGHFDVRRAIQFKGLQTHARSYRELDAIPDSRLLEDLYALDRKGRLYAGVDTYIRILMAGGYTAPLGWLMNLPGCRQLAARVYRRIADGRERLSCDESCAVEAVPEPAEFDELPFAELWKRYAATPRQRVQRVAKFLVVVLVLQLNSTLHYGIFYRWAGTRPEDPALAMLDHMSDSIINFSHTFLGITPHALYMHDHFAGYEHILALSYRDKNGREEWLPFINAEGRLLAPSWGRVQSMWANVAVTSHMKRERLDKFLRKLTAYWGVEMGVDLDDAEFVIKMKQIRVPMDWENDLRHRNMAGSWQDIGTVEWHQGRINVDIPQVDVEALDEPKQGAGSLAKDSVAR